MAFAGICLTASVCVADVVADNNRPHFASGPPTQSFVPIDATADANNGMQRPLRLPPVQFKMAGHSTATQDTKAKLSTTSLIRQPGIPASSQSASESTIESPRDVSTATEALLTLPMPQSSPETMATTRRPSVTLASQTSWSHAKQIESLLDQSKHDLQCRAYAAAEGYAWEALALSAEMIDLARSEVASSGIAACELLHRGRTAMDEAAHFVTMARAGDTEAVARIAKSHETQVLSDFSVSSFVAVDQYLDHARICFTPIAAGSVQAARAMDLIAAIRLGRANQTQLPGPTSLCLRRAAAGGQPSNAAIWDTLSEQLADTGLMDEARWAKVQGQAVMGQRLATQVPIESMAVHVPQEPTIVQMSPDQFAAVSHSVIPHDPATAANAPYPATGGSVNAGTPQLRSASDATQVNASHVPDAGDATPQREAVSPFRAVADRWKRVTSLASWRRRSKETTSAEPVPVQGSTPAVTTSPEASAMGDRRPSWSLPNTKLRW